MTIDIICVLYQLSVICGVDEAGKGSVLGPLVVAGVAAPDMKACDNMGFLDSKLLSRSKREKLFLDIEERFSTAVVIIEASEIDAQREETGMNEIVARAHASAISSLNVDLAYVDACDVNEIRYGRTVGSFLDKPCNIISEHRADSTYPLVSAASIVAKVIRDRAMDSLNDEPGDPGSGYPSDPKTISYLTDYINEHGTPPVCARRSWKTVSVLMDKLDQTSLFDF